jgi:predicted ATP-grasp superfamily ATP-dependent carboligase
VKQPLAIVGASTRSAAASAVRAGFQPLAADLFADADLRHIATATRVRPYPEGLVDWLRAIGPPAWMYTGALENQPELVDQMAWIAPLLGNAGDVLARVRSPWELAGALRSAGLLFPETRATAEGLPRDGSWLVKTYCGASGSGVRAFEAPLQIREALGEGSGEVYQQRIRGIPCATVYIAADGTATLLGVTRQLIGEPWLGSHKFQYSGSIGPWPVSNATRETLTRIGNVLAEQFELVGLFGVDFILDGGQVWTVEVNPRYTASVEIIERFYGVCAIAEHMAACNRSLSIGGRAGASSVTSGAADRPASCSSHGKAILFAKRDFVISQAFAEETLAEALRTPWPTLADISPVGTPVEAGRPILTLFASAQTVDEVEVQLKTRACELENELY